MTDFNTARWLNRSIGRGVREIEVDAPRPRPSRSDASVETELPIVDATTPVPANPTH